MPHFADRPELTRVWPTAVGLTGINPYTNKSQTLIPFVKGWMDWPNAIIARDAGDVQIMVHEAVSTLQYPPAADDVIPVVQTAYVETGQPKRVYIVFNEPVALDNELSFSLTGTYAGAIVNANENNSPFMIDLLLDTDVVLGDTLSVVHTAVAGSNLRNKDFSAQKVADFTQAVTNNVISADVVITTASGTDAVPAVITFSGDFLVGDRIVGRATGNVGEAGYSMNTVANLTPEQMAIDFADYASGNPNFLVSAVGATVEFLGNIGNTTFTLTEFDINPPPIVNIEDANGTDIDTARIGFAEVGGFQLEFPAGTRVTGTSTTDVVGVVNYDFTNDVDMLSFQFAAAFAEYADQFEGVSWVGDQQFADVLAADGDTVVTLTNFLINP